MSVASSFLRKIAEPVAVFTGLSADPVSQAISAGASEIAKDNARREAKEYAKQQEAKLRRQLMAMQGGEFGGPGTFYGTPSVSNAGRSSGLLSTIRGGIQDVGGIFSDLIDTGIPDFFGFGRGSQSNNQTAVTTTGNLGAQETSGSGTIDAFTGALPGLLTGGLRNLLKTPGGQVAIGTGAGLATNLFGSDGKKPRITRKMKSQYRTVLNLAGGNLTLASQMLGISEEMLIMVLLKRFRNDGPVVTKAALRKTKSTIRRLHSMQDVLKSITPTSTGRRRAPMKRAMSTTLIKN